MPIAYESDEPCPNCREDTDVWVFEKREGSATKECYTCEACGFEWSEIA